MKLAYDFGAKIQTCIREGNKRNKIGNKNFRVGMYSTFGLKSIMNSIHYSHTSKFLDSIDFCTK